MDLQLKGKKVVITGASAGIGLASAIALASEGCRLVLIARNKARLERAVAEVNSVVPEAADGIPADLTELAAIEQVVIDARDELGGIDIWVNNAGAIRGGAFLDVPDSQWASDWSLKLMGYVRCSRAVLPLMQPQGGCIVNVVGAAARLGNPMYLAGGMANSALVNFTKGLSQVGAPRGVFVKAVSPGAVAGERWERLVREEAAATGVAYVALRAERLAAHPLGRLVTVQEVAELVCILASNKTDMLNGATVTIDGGANPGVYL